MTRYLVVLACLAVFGAALFGLAGRWGLPILNMFATMVVAIFFIVAAIALGAWQALEAYRRLKAALKKLEPNILISDLSHHKVPKGAEVAPPDLVLVTPGGVAAVMVDDLPDNASQNRARRQLARRGARARAGVEWIRRRSGDKALPVAAVLVLLRRLSGRDEAPPGVNLVNPEVIPAWLEATLPGTILNREAQVRLTQLYRAAED